MQTPRLALAVAVAASMSCGGGGDNSAPAAIDPRFVGQTGLASRLNAVASTLASNPPTTAKAQAARKAAITDLDNMLWGIDVAGSPGADISAYYKSQMNKVVAEMAQPVTEGVRIWAVYNAGFIVKSPGKTVAFDLVDDRPGLPTDIPKDFKLFGYTWPASVTDQIDVLVISHEHYDHSGSPGTVAARVKAHGGAVLYPRAGLAFPNATILIDSGATGTVNGVSYIALKQPHATTPSMGYQLVLPNGYRIVHQDAEYTMIRNVKNIDVLFEGVWINGATLVCKDAFINEMATLKPGLTIPSHMQESSHPSTGDGRCGAARYRYTYPLELQDEATPSPYALLTWGESITYKR